MSMIFFTFRAQTGARQGALILSQAGISARVGRTPSGMAEYGRGYAGAKRLRIWDLGQRPSGRPGSRAPAEQKAQL